MKKYEFVLPKTDVSFVVNDDSAASEEFKEKLIGWLKDILNSNVIAGRLREINVFLEDMKIGERHIERIKTMELTGVIAIHHFNKGIVIQTDWCEACYNLRGEPVFLKNLNRTITHELVHYVYEEINAAYAKLMRVNEALLKKYAAKYPLFQNPAFAGALELMNTFIDLTVNEGFAQLISQMKNDDLVFTEAKFDELYAVARNFAQKIVDVFMQASKVESVEEMRDIIIDNVLEIKNYAYPIGLHIIYALFFFHKTDLEKDADYVIDLFARDFGTQKPKVLVKEYARVMQENGKIPVMSYDPTPFIDLNKLQETWQILVERHGMKTES